MTVTLGHTGKPSERAGYESVTGASEKENRKVRTCRQRNYLLDEIGDIQHLQVKILMFSKYAI